MTELQDLNQIKSPWNKAYWFARYLKNTDKYGNVGSDSKHILKITKDLRLLIGENPDKKEDDLLQKAKEVINNLFI